MNFKSVRSKLILAFVILIICPSTIIGSVLYIKSVNILQEKTGQIMITNLKQDVKAVENCLTETYYLAIRLSSSNETIEEIQTVIEADKETRKKELMNMSSEYSRTAKKYRYIDSIYIYIPKIKTVMTTYGMKNIISVKDDENFKWLRLIKKGKTNPNNWISILNIKDDFFSHEKNFFTISKQIKNFNHEESLGELRVNVDERVLFFNFLNNGGKKLKNIVFVIDEEGRVVSHPKVDLIGLNFSKKPYIKFILNREEGYFVDTVGGKKHLITFVTSKLTNYKIVSLIDQNEIISEIKDIKSHAISVMGICMIVSVIIGFIFSLNIYEPIKKLKYSMEEVGKGDFNIKIIEKREDEFGILNKGFNQMVMKVNNLFNEVYVQKLLKKEAELQALQSQVAPHFMYNTLNSIRCVAILQESKTVAEMLGALIELLQLSAGNKMDFITLDEEIKQVKNYILLQKFRYRDLFQVRYEIDKSILMCKVPKLILQPLVDNSIRYGINLRRGDGIIKIRVIKDEKDILLEVEDNGVGMTVDEIKEIIRGKKEQKVGGTGINNINKRIKLYFGDCYELTMRNREEGGLIVRMRIPMTFEGEGEDD
ncbi:sensor histidine kinase [Anaeromicrobium sediminis]|uniref:sensor histidine kinase n=1 Tax=Anaeromicrobium sediminis TaxID=1478221 RepID=UPI0015961374|nr:sensor histidine kinase [Anaeromicrobium sediminis]